MIAPIILTQEDDIRSIEISRINIANEDCYNQV